MQSIRCEHRSKWPRKWLRFSLRGVLAAVAVLAAWLGYHSNLASSQRRAIRQLQELDGVVYVQYDWQYDEQGNGRQASWLRKAIGDNLFSRVTEISVFSDSLHESMDVDGLNLEGLAVDITDGDLAILGQFTHLERLYLNDTKITDAGLIHIADLRSLRVLCLQRTQITDAGLRHFHPLTNLQYLFVDQCAVTPEGAARLRRALPNTDITPAPSSSGP